LSIQQNNCNIKLYNEDCFIILPFIENKSIDLICIDPPYGITNEKWDILMPFDLLWKEYNRIIKDTGVILIFGQEPFSSKVRLSNLENYKYDIYWQKEKPTNIFQLKNRLGKTIETISVFYRNQYTFNPQMVKHYGKKVINKIKGNHTPIYAGNTKLITEYNDTGWRYPSQLIKINREINGAAEHPTQKPVKLLEWLIKTFSNESGLVLDNCMGSGSTGVACVNSRRKFIGIEKNNKLFKIAEDRITIAKKSLIKNFF